MKKILKTPAGSAGSPLWKVVSCEDREYPLGLTHIDGGIHVSVAVEAKKCTLLLFPHESADRKLQEQKAEMIRIPFPATGHVGTVWEISLKGFGFESYDYAFEADGVVFSDPYGKSFTGHEVWGDLSQAGCLLKSPIACEPFDWGDDQNPRIAYEDSVVYCAHVRGLTMHESSGVVEKGTFAGVAEKIPYLKKLGITTLELLPVAEFQEVIMPDPEIFDPYRSLEPTGKLNYWGYGPAFLYAPKASYAGWGKDPIIELKSLVKQLHQNGMELVLQMHFSGDEAPAFVLRVIRFWVREYHLDGVHLTGDASVQALLKDPYLTRTKIWINSLDGVDIPAEQEKHFGEYNDGFMIDMRRVLRGDAGQMECLTFRNRRNPDGYGVLNYIAGVNGFTLADMVSYEEKHNEANGEKNRDGSDYNCTWNCGVEGPTNKKKVVALRKQQMRNALLLVFLSQGTPVLLAGDEFGNSQNGNNNAYCQDNEISWLNWNDKEKNKDIFEFFQYMIKFRKDHSVIRRKEEACSLHLPEMSSHSNKPWVEKYDWSAKVVGIMYTGSVNEEDDIVYVVTNAYWGEQVIELPRLMDVFTWKMVVDTGKEDSIIREEKLVPDRRCTIGPRASMVFVAVKKMPVL